MSRSRQKGGLCLNGGHTGDAADSYRAIAVGDLRGGVAVDIMPGWSVASRAGGVRGNGFGDLLAGDLDGGRYGARAGAAAVYQRSGGGSPPGDCDGDGSNRTKAYQMGRYHGRLVEDKDGRWRFAERNVYLPGMGNTREFLPPPPR